MGRRRGNSAFPVARIKKMMQADDDVGKIATVTPLLVAKALECMMELVLTEAASVARDRRSRTVTPLHLKHTVMRNDDFDFLRPVFRSVDGALDDTASPSATALTTPGEETRPRRRISRAGTKRPRSVSRAAPDDAPPTQRRGRSRLDAIDPSALSRLPPLQAPSTANEMMTGVTTGAPSPNLNATVQSVYATSLPSASSTAPPPTLDDEEDYDGEDEDDDDDETGVVESSANVAVMTVDISTHETTEKSEVHVEHDQDDEETQPALPDPPPKADRVAVHALLS